MRGIRSSVSRRARVLACALSLPVVMMVSGCATQHPSDPLEPWNRGVFSFNDAVDAAVLKPVAEGYVQVTPRPIRTGVNNFFGNISDVWSSVNLFLQGRFKEGAASTMRVAVNTTLGLGGLIDLSTPMRLERYREDLGQTLGVWGVPSGPYLVWPLLGSSSVRDSASILGDVYFSATTVIDGAAQDNMARVLKGVSTRAMYLSAGDLLDQVALDKYAFIRDAYLQRRESLIHVSRPPDYEDADSDASQPRYDLPEVELAVDESEAQEAKPEDPEAPGTPGA